MCRLEVIFVLLCGGFAFAIGEHKRDTWDGCGLALQYLMNQGITSQDVSTQLPSNGTHMCKGGPCCLPSFAEVMVKKAKTRLQEALSHNSAAFLHSVSAQKEFFMGSVNTALSSCEANTISMFVHSYPRLVESAKPVISKLFSAFRKGVTSLDEQSLERAMSSFWDDLFPIVYHSAVHSKLPPFAEVFKECLKDSRKQINPWNVLPKLLEDPVLKGLRSVRLLLHSLNVGTEVVKGIQDFQIPDECGVPAARLQYCAACHASLQLPCSAFCLNVARGCLAPLAEVQGSWEDLLSAIGRTNEYLKSVKIGWTLKQLPDKFSEAIMVAMVSGPKLQKKVRRHCGIPTYLGTDHNNRKLSNSSKTKQWKSLSDEVPGDADEIVFKRLDDSSHIIRELENSRNWWVTSADDLCASIVSSDDEVCWNGHRVGRYSKSPVPPGVSAQKYNPEVMVPRPDSRVYGFNNKLREVKRLVTSRLTWLPESVAYREGDDYDEASGMYAEAQAVDEEDERYGSGEWGSGEPPPHHKEVEETRDIYADNKLTITASSSGELVSIVVLVTLGTALSIAMYA